MTSLRNLGERIRTERFLAELFREDIIVKVVHSFASAQYVIVIICEPLTGLRGAVNSDAECTSR